MEDIAMVTKVVSVQQFGGENGKGTSFAPLI